MIYVVGSGPSGVSCARMLLKKGARVTLLDVGLKLEEDRKEIVRRVREKEKTQWDEEILSRYKAGFLIRGKKVKYKPVYGSLFPYRDVSPSRILSRNVTAGFSYAQGGLSNVWGASVNTYRPEDIKDWPIEYSDLMPYFHEIFSFVPSARAENVPGITEGFSPSCAGELKMSTQLRSLSDRLQRSCVVAGKGGVSVGASRLAVRRSGKGNLTSECVYCGLCMYGCPFSLVYNSAETLAELERHKNFTYMPGILVESLKEAGGEVQIHARDLASGRTQIFSAEKVYLGSGVFPSASILLRSYDAYDHPLFCLDSACFQLPMISAWAAKGVATEDLHTLAQLCLRMQGSVSGKAAFLQVYGYNDLYKKTLQFWSGFSYPLFRGLFNACLERLFLVLGFLHSDDSARIKITLRRKLAGGSELSLEGIRSRASFAAIRNILEESVRLGQQIGVFPIRPMIDVGAPGRGYHAGGTFPMRVQPGFWESDLLGRPHGFKKVHLVDASIFPTIPAGPITINVMANAARIADQSL